MILGIILTLSILIAINIAYLIYSTMKYCKEMERIERELSEA